METLRTWRVWLFGGGSVFVGLWLFAQRARELWGWTIDDAGITYAYARHLAEGFGPVMTPGGPWVLGISNPLLALLLAPVHLVGLDVEAASKVIGLGCGVGAGLVVVWAAPLADDLPRRLGAITFGVPLAFVALCLSYASWSFGGLENSLYGLLLAATLGLDLYEQRDPHRPPFSAFTLSLACATRPEALLYVATFGALKLLDAARSRGHRRALLRFALVIGVLVGGQHLLQYAMFGAWVPNTYIAKLAAPGEAFDSEIGPTYLERAFEAEGLALLVPLLVLGWPRRLRAGAAILAVLVPAVFFVIYARGDWMPRFRFITWTLPILGLLGLLTLRRIAYWISDGRALLLLAAMPLAGYVLPPTYEWALARHTLFEDRGVDEGCMYCDVLRQSRNLDGAASQLELPHYSVVVMDLGGFAFRTSPRVFAIDWAGLCDRSLGLMARRLRTSLPQSSLADLERRQYLFHESAEPPTLVHITPHFWSASPSVVELRQSYFRLNTGRYAMDPRLFMLHRSRYVDYFPDVDRIAPRRLGELRVIGSSCRDGRVRAALTPIATGRVPESVTFDILGRRTDVPLVAACRDCRDQWEPGEPVVVEAALPRGVRRARLLVGGASVPLCEDAVDGRAPAAPDLERFVRNLPPPQSTVLRALAARVRAHLRERDRRADYTFHDDDLARELVDHARAAEDEDARYLAWVLAQQASPSADRHSAEPLFRMRPRRSLHRFTASVTALRRAYAGSAADVRRAAITLASLGDEDAVDYLLARAPDLSRADLQAHAPRAPGGVDGDFEREDPRGWTLRGFMVQDANLGDDELPITGHLGRRVVGSFSARNTWAMASTGTGTAESAPFVAGEAVSLFVGGVGRASIELLGESGLLARREVALAPELQPVFFDEAAIVGQRVRLRVIDDDRQSAVAFDVVRVWR